MTTKRDHQIILEKLFSKNQLIPRIKSEFMNCDVNFSKIFKDNNIPEEVGFSLLVQMALHKRAKFEVMVGLLRNAAGSAQAAADYIKKMCELDLCHWHPVQHVLVVALPISDDVQRELDKFQFPLPMVVKPVKVKNNRDTGYILSRGSIILKNNHHEGDVVLDHINRVNSIPLTINNDTAVMIHNEWRNMDKPKDGESAQDFEKRKRAFEKYDRTAHEVIGTLTQEGNEFFVTHKYDKRGRVYSQGYHVNPQGTSWNKAVVELAEKEVVQL